LNFPVRFLSEGGTRSIAITCCCIVHFLVVVTAQGMASETSPGTAASTTSDTLATYVTDYRMENGRRYHAYADGEYWVSASPHRIPVCEHN